MSDPYFDEFGAPVVPLTNKASDMPPVEDLNAILDQHLQKNPPPGFGSRDEELNAADVAAPRPKMGPPPGDPEMLIDEPTGPLDGSKPVDPYTGVNAPHKTPGMLDMAGWDSEQERAIAATGNAARDEGNARLSAEQSQSDRRLAAQSAYTDSLTKIDQKHQAARLQNEATADAETATWLRNQQDLSTKEPNRARYWESQSSFGKAMWLLGVGATAFANMNHPGAPNMASQMLMDEVNADVAAQKDRLANQREFGRTQGAIMKDKQNRRVHDAEDDYSKAFQRLESVKSELMERAKRPGSAERAAMDAGVALQIQQAQTALVGQHNQRAVQMYMAKSQQDHASALQGAMIKHQTDEKALDRQLARDLAEERIQAKIDEIAAKAGGAGDKDMWKVNEQSGLRAVIRDPATGAEQQVPAYVHKDLYKEYMPKVTAANDEDTKLRTIQRELKNMSWSDFQRGGTSTFKEAMIGVNYELAKKYNSKVTDKDYEVAEKEATGGNNTFLQRIWTPGDSIEQVRALFDQRVRNHASIVNNDLSALPNPHGEVYRWSPQKTTTDEARTLTPDEAQAKLGVKSNTPVPQDEQPIPDDEADQVTAALSAIHGASKTKIGEINSAASDGLSYTSRQVITKAAIEEGIHAGKAEAEAVKALATYAASNGIYSKPLTDAKVKEELLNRGISQPSRDDVARVTKEVEDFANSEGGTKMAARKALDILHHITGQGIGGL